MTDLVIEDGTGKTSSNTYVTEAELTTYATDRGVTISGTKSELIFKAMDYIESLKYQGTKNTLEQALQFPRYGVCVDGYTLASDTIPELLKQAQMEFCIGIDGGVNPLANETRETKREKVGSLEVEYSDNARATDYLTAGHAKIEKLLSQQVFNVRV